MGKEKVTPSSFEQRDGLTASVSTLGVANQSHASGCLVTSGHCWPSAADEEWYSPKKPSSTVAVQHSSGNSTQCCGESSSSSMTIHNDAVEAHSCVNTSEIH